MDWNPGRVRQLVTPRLPPPPPTSCVSAPTQETPQLHSAHTFTSQLLYTPGAGLFFRGTANPCCPRRSFFHQLSVPTSSIPCLYFRPQLSTSAEWHGLQSVRFIESKLASTRARYSLLPTHFLTLTSVCPATSVMLVSALRNLAWLRATQAPASLTFSPYRSSPEPPEAEDSLRRNQTDSSGHSTFGSFGARPLKGTG